MNYASTAIFEFKIPAEFRNSIVHFKEDKGVLFAISPFQVFKFKHAKVKSEGFLRSKTVFKFTVKDDYKNYIKWQRKEVIKGVV